jgi:hypothetical protein
MLVFKKTLFLKEDAFFFKRETQNLASLQRMMKLARRSLGGYRKGIL